MIQLSGSEAGLQGVHFTGVHHVRIPVRELGRNVDWYEVCLDAERVARFDHHDSDGAVFAVVLELPGAGPMVELRIDPAAASGAAGYRPVAFGVGDRAGLDRWVAHFDGHHIEHSEVTRRRIAHSVDVQAPDGLVLGFYTDPVGGFAGVEYVE